MPTLRSFQKVENDINDTIKMITIVHTLHNAT